MENRKRHKFCTSGVNNLRVGKRIFFIVEKCLDLQANTTGPSTIVYILSDFFDTKNICFKSNVYIIKH